VTGGFDGDVIVLLEVETGLLLGGIVGHTEEFAFDTSVAGAGDMLAISPLTIAASAVGGGSARTTSRSICSGVELATALGVTVAGRSGSTGATRSEVGSVGPVATTTGTGAGSVTVSVIRQTNDILMRLDERGLLTLQEAVPRHFRCHSSAGVGHPFRGEVRMVPVAPHPWWHADEEGYRPNAACLRTHRWRAESPRARDHSC
jgi:hypothetical protein